MNGFGDILLTNMRFEDTIALARNSNGIQLSFGAERMDNRSNGRAVPGHVTEFTFPWVTTCAGDSHATLDNAFQEGVIRINSGINHCDLRHHL